MVLRHTGSTVLAQNVEFVVNDEAELNVVSVQQWADDAIHASAHYAKLGRNARFKHVVVSLGGDLVRVTPPLSSPLPALRLKCTACTS